MPVARALSLAIITQLARCARLLDYRRPLRSLTPPQCEQVSHHPPISAAYYGCPAKGIEAVGVDQILARVSGMCKSSSQIFQRWTGELKANPGAAVKVGPGDTNKGIFVRIKRPGPGQGEVRTPPAAANE